MPLKVGSFICVGETQAPLLSATTPAQSLRHLSLKFQHPSQPRAGLLHGLCLALPYLLLCPYSTVLLISVEILSSLRLFSKLPSMRGSWHIYESISYFTSCAANLLRPTFDPEMTLVCLCMYGICNILAKENSQKGP